MLSHIKENNTGCVVIAAGRDLRQMPNDTQVELLMPAGDLEKLRFAFAFGADAALTLPQQLKLLKLFLKKGSEEGSY